MSEKVKIAIDSMGGENAPQKILKGIIQKRLFPFCLDFNLAYNSLEYFAKA